MPKYSMIIFVGLNILAMLLYPGGNINNPDQIGYSFIYNFFSDLGMTISHSGKNLDQFIGLIIKHNFIDLR